MQVSSRLRDGQAFVMLSGELDVADAALVATVLTTVASGRQQIVVDLTELAFIDSSGLAALVRARRHARKAGFDVLLAAPQQQVRRMLATTRLAEVFSVHACVEDATRNAALASVT
jgi:anti-sigma B factor antagonist